MGLMFVMLVCLLSVVCRYEEGCVLVDWGSEIGSCLDGEI